MAIFNIGTLSLLDYEYREYTISGFELYIVREWVSERNLTNVITSFTGNSNDIIHGVLIALPEDINAWPPKLKAYYEQISEFASLKVLESNISIFVTNLSFFPSTFNLLHVKDGSMKAVWTSFQVNFNLKRLGCSGRSRILLDDPPATSLEKFGQIYKITAKESDRMMQHVIDLIAIIQQSLTYFGFLDPIYKDGTLCQHTLKAIDDWWSSYGKLYLGIDRPKNEGNLGPTSVAGIISFVLTCYFKFIVEDCVPFKDPFVESSFYSGVYNFQKKYNLPKTSCLDLETINKLFKVTSRITNKDIFKLKRVLKSRVQDITGKVNPIQLANEILTTDLESLIHNIQGGYLGLIWNAKSSSRLKLTTRDFAAHNYNHGNPLRIDKYEVNDFDSNDSDTENPPIESSGNWGTLDSTVDESLCYQNFLNNNQFQHELYRRSSLPEVDSDINFFQTGYNYRKVRPNRPLGSSPHKRSESFSDVQDVVEKWSLPFQMSSVKVARDILFLERDLRETCAIHKNSQGIPLPIHDLSDVYNKNERSFKNFLDLQTGLTVKHEGLTSTMKELDSLQAKFNYDIRVLDTRMRDVEENIGQFGNKLDSLESDLKSRSSKFKALIDTQILNSAIELDKHAFEFFENDQDWNEGVFLKSLKGYVWPAIKKEWERTKQWWLTSYGNNDLNDQAT